LSILYIIFSVLALIFSLASTLIHAFQCPNSLGFKIIDLRRVSATRACGACRLTRGYEVHWLGARCLSGAMGSRNGVSCDRTMAVCHMVNWLRGWAARGHQCSLG